ncbi:MAG: NnrU family protein [Rhizobiaceae bacterium]
MHSTEMTTGDAKMVLLVLGLVIFLGLHSVRIFAADWREAQIAARGENSWKGIYSGVSILGFALMVYGYGVARQSTGLLYVPPEWGRSVLHVAMPIALVLFVASQLPMGHLKKRFGHPMLWGTVIWSAGHLLANGDTASVLLFGGFFVWALADLHSAFNRPAGEQEKPKVWPDLAAMVIGFVVTGIFVAFLHQWLIGVPVM